MAQRRASCKSARHVWQDPTFAAASPELAETCPRADSAGAPGMSFWYCHPKPSFSEDDARNLCTCGGFRRSRPHYMWQCPDTAGFWRHLAQPTEQRSACTQQIVTPPRSTPVCWLERHAAWIRGYIARGLQTLAGPLVLATDGSASQGVGAWAVPFWP